MRKNKMETPALPQQQNNQYFQAVIDAFKRVWKYKFLWIWGVFLPSGMSFNYGTDQKELEDVQTDAVIFQIKQFWMEYYFWIIIGLVVVFLLIIAFWIFSAIARGGVIYSINNLQELKETKQNKINSKKLFKKIWQFGKLRLWNILKLDLIFILIGLTLIIIIALPIFFSFKTNNPLAISLIIFLAVIVFIPIVFVMTFTKNIGLIFVVLAKENPLKSIEHGYNLLIKNQTEAIKLIFTLLLLMISFGIIAGITLATTGGLSLLIFRLMYAVTGFNLTVLASGIILGLIFLSLLLLIKSISALWYQDIWIWWVKKISSVRIKETETSMPEEELINKKPKIITEEKIS